MTSFALNANRETFISQALFAALDTETTGLSPSGFMPHRVVELGAVLFQYDGTVVDRFNTYVDPQRPIPYEARSVHGISDADVVGAPLASDALKALMGFLAGADMLWGFNSPFDMRFLVSEFLLSSMEAPPIEFYDVRRMLKRCGLPTGTLEAVAGKLGIKPSTFHRATDDAETTALVVCEAIAAKFGPFDTLGSVAELHSSSTPVYNTATCLKSLR